MISPISQKLLKDINIQDIQSLVDNQIPESYDIDYKQDYPNNKKLAKIELKSNKNNYELLILLKINFI